MLTHDLKSFNDKKTSLRAGDISSIHWFPRELKDSYTYFPLKETKWIKKLFSDFEGGYILHDFIDQTKYRDIPLFFKENKHLELSNNKIYCRPGMKIRMNNWNDMILRFASESDRKQFHDHLVNLCITATPDSMIPIYEDWDTGLVNHI